MATLFPLEPQLLSLIFSSYEGDTSEGIYHGKGKATFRNGQTYHGQFSGGRMHGKGKFVWNDGTCYVGSFEYNQVNGKGIYKWPDNSQYDGEVLNGLRNGQGEFHHGSNAAHYVGTWKNGLRDGTGVIKFDYHGKVYYDGEWKKDMRHGDGEMHYASGNIYQGKWANDAKCGKGVMQWFDVNERYEGEWLNDLQHGNGEHRWDVGNRPENTGPQKLMSNRYVGEFKEGKRHGFGTFYYANGAKYQGEWDNNVKHGQGIFIFEDGNIYSGEFNRDKIVNYKAEKCQDGAQAHILLHIDDILPADDQDSARIKQEVMNTVIRIKSELKHIYKYYSTDPSICYTETEGVFTMTMQGVWKFCSDCSLLNGSINISAVNRMFLAMRKQQFKALDAAKIENSIQFDPLVIAPLGDHESKDLHDGGRVVLFREFVELIIRLVHAYTLMKSAPKELSVELSMLFEEKIKDFTSNEPATEFQRELYSTDVSTTLVKYSKPLLKLYHQFARDKRSTHLEHYSDITLSVRGLLLLLKSCGALTDEFTSTNVLNAIFESYDDNGEATSLANPFCLDTSLVFVEFQQAIAKIADHRIERTLPLQIKIDQYLRSSLNIITT